jgi:hypothetical protein
MRQDLDADGDPWKERDEEDDEVRDLSPGAFRFLAAVLIGLAVLAIAGTF